MADFSLDIKSKSDSNLSIDLSVSVSFFRESPFIREKSVFPFSPQDEIPAKELPGGHLALEANNKCSIEQADDKEQCQAFFKLYEEALKAADGAAPTERDRAALGADSPEIALVQKRGEALEKEAHEITDKRNVEVETGSLKAMSLEDAKLNQQSDFRFDQRANMSGIRYAYAASLSAYGQNFQDQSAMVKAKNLIGRINFLSLVHKLACIAMNGSIRLPSEQKVWSLRQPVILNFRASSALSLPSRRKTQQI